MQINRSWIAIGGLFIAFLAVKTLNPYRKAFFRQDSPQIILVLGGDIKREKVGVQLSKALELPLLVSSGSNPEHAQWLVSQSGIPPKQVTLDYRAKDTLSNFTSLVDEMARKNIRHALIVTSADHLPRAATVGNVIAGSRGIKITTLPVSCTPKCHKESRKKHIMDSLRAIYWVITGLDPKDITQNEFLKIFNVD